MSSPEPRQRAEVAGLGRGGPSQLGDRTATGAAAFPRGSQLPASVPDAGGGCLTAPQQCGCVMHTCPAPVSFHMTCNEIQLSTSLLFTLNFKVQMPFTYK